MLEALKKKLGVEDALDEAINDREVRDLPRWGSFAADPYVQEIRHKNQRERLEHAPRLGEIIAVELTAITNTGDLVVLMECAGGAVYELRCAGHQADARLPVNDVSFHHKGDLKPHPLPKGIFSAGMGWTSYPQREGDDSPPVWQPNYQLQISHKITRFEDVYPDDEAQAATSTQTRVTEANTKEQA